MGVRGAGRVTFPPLQWSRDANGHLAGAKSKDVADVVKMIKKSNGREGRLLVPLMNPSARLTQILKSKSLQKHRPSPVHTRYAGSQPRLMDALLVWERTEACTSSSDLPSIRYLLVQIMTLKKYTHGAQ